MNFFYVLATCTSTNNRIQQKLIYRSCPFLTSKIIDELNYGTDRQMRHLLVVVWTHWDAFGYPCVRLPSTRVIPRQGVSSSTESHSRRNLRHLYGERTARRFHPIWWMWRASWGRGWLLPRSSRFVADGE